MTRRPSQVYIESVYAFAEAIYNYSLRCAVKQTTAGPPGLVRSVRKGGVSGRVVADLSSVYDKTIMAKPSAIATVQAPDRSTEASPRNTVP
jgi:hypothetical protein